MIHKLKTIQPYFDEVVKGIKTFELRENDRNFKVGDRLDLFEGDEQVDDINKRENKNHVHKYISYILEGGNYGLENGYVILALSDDEV